jgi:hypothetical protein
VLWLEPVRRLPPGRGYRAPVLRSAPRGAVGAQGSPDAVADRSGSSRRAQARTFPHPHGRIRGKTPDAKKGGIGTAAWRAEFVAFERQTLRRHSAYREVRE